MNLVPMVQLTPKGWLPNPNLTGGNWAPQTIHISYTFWMALEQPQDIEEYYEKLAALESAPVADTFNFRGFVNPPEA